MRLGQFLTKLVKLPLEAQAARQSYEQLISPLDEKFVEKEVQQLWGDDSVRFIWVDSPRSARALILLLQSLAVAGDKLTYNPLDLDEKCWLDISPLIVEEINQAATRLGLTDAHFSISCHRKSSETLTPAFLQAACSVSETAADASLSISLLRDALKEIRNKFTERPNVLPSYRLIYDCPHSDYSGCLGAVKSHHRELNSSPRLLRHYAEFLECEIYRSRADQDGLISWGAASFKKFFTFIWFYSDVVIISRKPKVLFDRSWNLHNENGPAISFADGWSLWAKHGINVPASS